MDAVFGRLFRRQEQDLPLWLKLILSAIGICAALCLCIVYYRFCWRLWSFYLSLPYSKQTRLIRLTAFIIGVFSLSREYRSYMQRLFLAPAMRDLATTPGSNWKILRVGLSLQWKPLIVELLFPALFLHPFFYLAWQSFLPVRGWVWLPLLSTGYALLWAVLGLQSDLLAVALNLVSASLGFGGVAPRAMLPPRLGFALRAAGWMSFIGLSALALLTVLVDNPSQVLQESNYWRTGKFIVASLEAPGTCAHALFTCSPTVLFMDALRSSVDDRHSLYQFSMFGCIAWTCLAALAGLLCLKTGYGIAARSDWQGGAGAKPADVALTPKRRFDPDGINGPIERWMISHAGRMGRAVLRMTTGVFESGAVDMHLKDSLKLVPLCLIGAGISMLAVPELIEAIYVYLYESPLPGGSRADIARFVAALWVGAMAIWRFGIWGVLRLNALNRQQHARPQFGIFILPAQQERRGPQVRGDNRYPLTEIYPVGFSDMVLLDTAYALVLTVSIGAIAILEGVILGLPAHVLGWGLIISVPVLVHLTFIGSVMRLTLMAKHYRRTWFRNFLNGLRIALIFVVMFHGMGGLIAALCVATVENGNFFAAWLGSINILLVFDIAFYMTMRTIYVRRRFDSETRLQGFR